MDRNSLKLYAVTDRAWLGEMTMAEAVEQAILGGTTMVQLREKNLSYDEFKKEALDVQAICKKYKVPFLINDNVDLAIEIDADGVHVGQSDLEAGLVRHRLGSDKIIGVTAKTIEQARLAQQAGADYLGSGAVFGTSTKADAKPMDMDTLRSIVASVDIPVVAIGGIDATNAAQLAGTGIAGLAVVSGIFAQPDIRHASEVLRGINLV